MESDTVRFGLIGCGAWGSQHADAILKTPGAQLIAIAEPSSQNRTNAQIAYPTAAIYTSYAEMLTHEEPDVIDIVLPSNLHYEVAKASLAAGCHVLLEKPMCLQLDHCDELIALAQQKNRHLAIGHEFRFSSLWGKVKELLDEGAIGDPRYCLVELWRRPFRLGTNGWRYDSKQVGSWILEEPIHFLDLARWYFERCGDPVSIFASASHRQDEHPDLQDNFSAVLHFSNGGYAVISQTLGGYEHHQTVKLTGTKGAIWASWSGSMDRTFDPTFSLKYFNGEKIEIVPIADKAGEVYELRFELANMTAIVRGCGRPLCGANGTDGRRAVEMCLKAQESIKTRGLAYF
jgi:myo-inositol 2-dehydrogenase/D-chiro-inositol 1-dehydrogenase